jgi:hypothetical protein
MSIIEVRRNMTVELLNLINSIGENSSRKEKQKTFMKVIKPAVDLVKFTKSNVDYFKSNVDYLKSNVDYSKFEETVINKINEYNSEKLNKKSQKKLQMYLKELSQTENTQKNSEKLTENTQSHRYRLRKRKPINYREE